MTENPNVPEPAAAFGHPYTAPLETIDFPLCVILQLYYLENLPEDLRDFLDTHLLQCPECLEWLASHYCPGHDGGRFALVA